MVYRHRNIIERDNYSSQARQESLPLLKTCLRYHKCLKSYQYMCNIVKSRVNNSKSSRTYTQEARETPVLNLKLHYDR
jgi:hypothetical protein